MDPALELAVEEIRDALVRGELEAAHRLLDTLSPIEPDVPGRLVVAAVAEDIGALDRAIHEYNLILREDPACLDAYARLFEVRCDLGDGERARRCLMRWERLAPEDARLPASRGRLHAMEREDGAEGDEPSIDVGIVPQGPSLPFTDADAMLLSSLFAGREAVHARQWTAPSERTGYSPVHEPFSPEVARHHLAGDLTAGFYLIKLDQTTQHLCFDLDIAAYLRKPLPSGKRMLELQGLVQRTAVRLQDACASVGLEAHVEDSGHKGRHVWVVFEVPLPARDARRIATRILETAPSLPAEVTLEVFPKQDRVAPGGLGNLVKVPLGLHRQSGRRSLWLLPTGHPVPDQLGYLRTLARVTKAAAEVVLAMPAPGTRSPRPRRETPDGDLSDGEADPEEPGTVRAPRALPAAPDWNADEDEDLQWLLGRCHALGRLWRRGMVHGDLSPQHRLVLRYTLGYLPTGVEAVNHVLSRCQGVDPAEFMKSPFRGFPMGCRRIHERAPDVVDRDGCPCPATHGPQAHPLALLVGRPPAPRPLEQWLADWLRTRGEIQALEDHEKVLSERIRKLMAREGLTEIRTSQGAVSLGHEGQLRLVEGPAAGQPAPSAAVPRRDNDEATDGSP